jgi:hypothetical protein
MIMNMEKSYNTELHNLYSLTSPVMVINSRNVRWTRNMEETRTMSKMFTDKRHEKRSMHRQNNNIQMALRETGYAHVKQNELVQEQI